MVQLGTTRDRRAVPLWGKPAADREADGAATLAVVGGLTYAVLAAAEGIDLLGAPDLSAQASAVTRYYSGDHRVILFTAVAGTLALFAYVAFVGGVWSWLRRSTRSTSDSWAVLFLLGGIGGPVVAAAGQAANAILVADRAGLSASQIRALYQFYGSARTLGLVFIALVIVGATTSLFRANRIPGWMAAAAWVLGTYDLAMTSAALSASHALHRAALAGFITHTVWILVVCAWLMLPRLGSATEPVAVVAARLMFAAVALAAGTSGAALLAFPSSTPRFFSWGLSPPPLAALIGAFYVASALVFARGLRVPWAEARGLTLGIVALAAPVFVVTLVHLSVFDLSRLQAWLWVVLFAAFPLGAASVLVSQRRAPVSVEGSRLGPGARVALAIVAAVLAVLAGTLFTSPAGVTRWWAYHLPPLGGRVLAGWLVFIGFLAAWAAFRARIAEIRLELVSLVAFPAAAFLAGLRSFPDLAPPHRRLLYLSAIFAILVGAGVVWSKGRRRRQRPLRQPAAVAFRRSLTEHVVVAASPRSGTTSARAADPCPGSPPAGEQHDDVTN